MRVLLSPGLTLCVAQMALWPYFWLLEPVAKVRRTSATQKGGEGRSGQKGVAKGRKYGRERSLQEFGWSREVGGVGKSSYCFWVGQGKVFRKGVSHAG